MQSREQRSPIATVAASVVTLLVGTGLEKLTHPQAACIARSLHRRERVVSAYDFVSVSKHLRRGPKKSAP